MKAEEIVKVGNMENCLDNNKEVSMVAQDFNINEKNITRALVHNLISNPNFTPDTLS